MPQNVVILGSTGSIGEQTLEVLSNLGPEFRVYGLSAHSSWKRLAEQAAQTGAARIAIGRPELLDPLRAALNGSRARVSAGEPALIEMVAADECDTVVSAVVGAAGLGAALEAVRRGKRTAIANKEPLVMAGQLLMQTARRTGAPVLPIDSEHSAVFQAMQAGRREEVRRIVLTASGGPFRETPPAALEQVTVEQALKHPTWNMGPKITVDSATMMNKALEVVEARWLFDLKPEQIEVVIHPESIIHSLVEFVDGSIIAQMGPPDMRTPIQYALTHPRRSPGVVPPLNLGALGQMRLYEPDLKRYPALALGFEVARTGGTSGAVLNAANEVAVQAFLDGKIRYVDIAATCRRVLEGHRVRLDPELPHYLEADRAARLAAAELVEAA
jgi:1-deoxy-D-xylulose-5-phosphate reductoisomerase